MSGPVDVLKILDIAEVIATTSGEAEDKGHAQSIRLARAAVADLTAACRVLLGEWDRQDSGNKFDPMPGKDWAAAEARFRAAVANVGGAK